MPFVLMHLATIPSPGEEVYLVEPGGPKAAIAVPLDALPLFLPILGQATERRPLPRCPACAAELPRGTAAPPRPWN
jgi:hypothetical protein